MVQQFVLVLIVLGILGRIDGSPPTDAEIKAALEQPDIVPPANHIIPYKPWMRPKVRANRLYPISQGRRWPANTIPYVIDTMFPVNGTERVVFLQAMNAIQTAGCTTFRPKIASDIASILFTNAGVGSGCNAFVGYFGPSFNAGKGLGVHPVNLEQSGCIYTGAAIHELLHVHGANHEHQRPDRDNYLTVLWNNISPDWWAFYSKMWDGNGVQPPACTPTNSYNVSCYGGAELITTFGVAYDIHSIMHYDITGGINGTRTMQPKDASITSAGGNVMTTLDVKKVRAAYQCDVSQCTVDHPYPYLNGSYCCKTNYERTGGGSAQEIASGTCDGSIIALNSTCCANDAYLACPNGTGQCGLPYTVYQCTADHPYPYLNGSYCCQTNYERTGGGSAQEIASGTCDGSTIALNSTCCANDAYLACPWGTGKCGLPYIVAQCTAAYPYPYLNGSYCCQTNYESGGGSAQEIASGTCDGSILALNSTCCATAYLACPSGFGKCGLPYSGISGK